MHQAGGRNDALVGHCDVLGSAFDLVQRAREIFDLLVQTAQQLLGLGL